MVAVIIATKNRPNDLKNYALKSLSKQIYKEFITIIWDASDNDESELVCNEFKDKINLVYNRANRIGAASQRNDAIDYTLSNYKNIKYIFFMDDDSEFSKDAIEGAIETFDDHKNLKGIYIPRIKEERNKKGKIFEFIWKCIRNMFLMFEFNNMYTTKYLYSHFKTPGINGEYINWICSSGAAYDISIFNQMNMRFNEEYQKFGGYALGEDIEFSLSISKFKNIFMTSKKGYHCHYPSSGGRLNLRNYFAAHTYNYNLMFDKLYKDEKKLKKVFYWILYKWNTLGFKIIMILKNKGGFMDVYNGTRDGRKASLEMRRDSVYN